MTLLLEWREIKNILLVFCRASGLQINWSKSTFHYSNLSDQTLNQLQFSSHILLQICLKASIIWDILLRQTPTGLLTGTGSWKKWKKELEIGATVGSPSVGVSLS
jgi:hypothetical protein